MTQLETQQINSKICFQLNKKTIIKKKLIKKRKQMGRCKTNNKIVDLGDFPGGSVVKNSPANAGEIWV